ncbi:MAG: acyl-CoA reductase [Bacteroidia bacterium]|nr:acyl-CoA reductase [Bacteroidia bacterium]
MTVQTDPRISPFIELGNRLQTLHSSVVEELCTRTSNENPWFTPYYTRMALQAVSKLMKADELASWINAHNQPATSKTVALILAGNIPLVGFHDFLCTLVMGHTAKIKLSSKDSALLRFVAGLLVEIQPSLSKQIIFEEQLSKPYHAVIATGSDNSARYFEYYFGKVPHIIRRNRSSCAVLTGAESPDEVVLLGTDVFSYFGLGCRNVSKLFVPYGYDFGSLLGPWEKYADIIHHHKYCNNYDYQKSLMLINQEPFLDSGFVMLKQSTQLVSPISVLFYEYYTDPVDLRAKLDAHADKIQVIIGKGGHDMVPFGEAQFPTLNDYADNVDTLAFLSAV